MLKIMLYNYTIYEVTSDCNFKRSGWLAQHDRPVRPCRLSDTETYLGTICAITRHPLGVIIQHVIANIDEIIIIKVQLKRH